MRYFIFIFTVICISCVRSNNSEPSSQSALSKNIAKETALTKLMLQADSIVLISHVLTREYWKVVEDYDASDTLLKLPKQKPLPAFLKAGKINPEIIIELVKVSNRQALVDILSLPTSKEEYNSIRCNQPHHSIILHKDLSQSYIDICFQCEKINPSENITLESSDFDKNKWKLLADYFKSSGIQKMFD